jgi:WD40 repeat protein
MEISPPNPFKGLRPYLKDDEGRLFGRDRDLILIKTRILSARTTLLFAGSGVGKTSFLNAKVIPQLQKQHCVLLHNRWTGVDEAEPEEVEENESIWWPPSEALSNLRSRLSKKPEPVKAKPAPIVAARASTPEEQLANRVTKTIAECLSSERSRPQALLEALALFKKSPKQSKEDDDEDAADPASPARDQSADLLSEEPLEKIGKDRCVLVLDQFEEVFQYHSDEEYFGEFIKDLCSIINDESYQIRVVISMREEFLGELSIFDNRIPDLFGNYYRLKHPSRDEPKEIIKRTCELSAVQPDPDNLSLLVRDLSTFEKSAANLGASSEPSAPGKVISRNFIAPPYLQIACERLWNEQYANPETALAHGPTELSKAVNEEDSKPAQFLANYGLVGAQHENGSGGAALRVLRNFCEEKLSAPYLSHSEQNLTARAFGFLVTKQGAKMAYELTSLADHMDARIAPLRRTLRKLSQPEARILRESRGLDRSYWFELYHDMYAGIVDDWKRGYLKHKKTTDRRKLAVGLLIPASIVLAVFVGIFWLWYPINNLRGLSHYRDNLAISGASPSPIPSDVVYAYKDVRETIGYGWYADRLWAEILEIRARQFSQLGDRNRALLTLLKAAAIRYPGPNQWDDLGKAEFLAGDSIGALAVTYGEESAAISISPDRKHLLSLTKAKTATLYDEQSPVPIHTFCTDCLRAIFANDGKTIVTLSPASENTNRAEQKKPRPNEATSQNGSANESQVGVTNQAGISNNQPNGVSPSATAMGHRIKSKYDNTGVQRKAPFEVRIYTIDEGGANRKPKVTLKDSMALNAVGSIPKATNDETDKAHADGVEDESRVPDLSAALALNGNRGSSYMLLGAWENNVVGWRLDAYTSVAEPFTVLAGGGENSTIVTGADGRSVIVDTQSKKALYRVSDQGVIHDPRITDFVVGALSADGKRLLADQSDKVIRLWDLGSGLQKVIGEKPKATKVAFSPSGEEFVIVSTTPAGEIAEIFASQTGSLIHSIEFKDVSTRVELGPDAKVLERVRIYGLAVSRPAEKYERWSLETNALLGSLKLPFEQTTKEFTADLGAVLTSREGRASEWRINLVEPPETILPTEDKLGFIQLSDDGNTLLTTTQTGDDFGERLWNAKTATPICDLQSGDLKKAGQAALSSDGRFAAKSASDRIRLWSIGESCKATDTHVGELVRHRFFVFNSLVFSPDNKMFAIATIATDAQEIAIAAFGSDSIPTMLKSGPNLSGIQFSPDGKYLLAAYAPSATTPNSRLFRIWTVADGREIELPGSFSEAHVPVVNSASQLIVWGGDSVARLWDLSSRRVIRNLNHDAEVAQAAFSEDGKSAVTVDENGFVKLWDLQTGNTTGTVKIAAEPEKVKFSDDGKHLLMARKGWVDHILIDAGALSYKEALAPGAYEFDSLSITGEQLRMVSSFDDGVIAVITHDLTHRSKNKTFSGDTKTMLKEWQERLGLSISDQGEFVPFTRE